jgi:hypothetical protein
VQSRRIEGRRRCPEPDIADFYGHPAAQAPARDVFAGQRRRNFLQLDADGRQLGIP